MRRTTSGGVCLTCIHVATCAFCRKEGMPPIWECEEFETQTPNPARIVGAEAPLFGSRFVFDALMDADLRRKGLCGDCENRGDCVFGEREGGVWHCEEYR